MQIIHTFDCPTMHTINHMNETGEHDRFTNRISVKTNARKRIDMLMPFDEKAEF